MASTKSLATNNNIELLYVIEEDLANIMARCAADYNKAKEALMTYEKENGFPSPYTENIAYHERMKTELNTNEEYCLLYNVFIDEYEAYINAVDAYNFHHYNLIEMDL